MHSVLIFIYNNRPLFEIIHSIPSPHTHSKPPVTAPKPSYSREKLDESVEHVEDGQEDLYVETNVFVEDREQQDSDVRVLLL